MAGTSPAVLANNTHVEVDAQDISGDLNQADLSMSTGMIDVSVFGITGWKEFITSISEFSIALAGFFDKAANKADAILFALFGAPSSPTTFELDIPNSNTGSVSYSGSAWGQDYKPSARVNDALKFSATLKGTAALERAILGVALFIVAASSLLVLLPNLS